MKTAEFKRSVSKTINPKLDKEAFKAALKSRQDLALVHSILGTRAAVGQLTQDFRAYLLGFAVNATMKAKGVDSLGDVLHHAINVARLVKGKVPGAEKVAKSKNTFAYLITEIDRTSADMLGTLVNAIGQTTFVPMTDAEKKVALEKHAKRAANAPGKKKDGGPTDQLVPPKPMKEASLTKIRTVPLDHGKIKQEVEALLRAAFEFTQAIYQKPVSKVMEQHIEKLKPNFPEGFFAPPPKKAKPAPSQKAAEPQHAAAH